MTIVKSTRAVMNYPYIRLDLAFVNTYTSCARSLSLDEVTLKLFECYCNLVQINITCSSLPSNNFNQTIRGFMGALHSKNFVNAARNSRMKRAREFIKVIDAMRSNNPKLNAPSWNPELPTNCRAEWDGLFSTLNEEAKKYWCCWLVKGRHSSEKHIPFHLIWHSHSTAFAIETYEAIRLYLETKTDDDTTVLKIMFEYLSQHADNYPIDTFQDPNKIHTFFEELCRFYFMDGYEKQRNINSLITKWSGMLITINSALIDKGKWARPFIPLPRPSVKQVKGGAKTHIKRTKEGTDVHQKLITDVPLQITDTEAIELLFKHVERDIDFVTAWAKKEQRYLYERYQRRIALSKEGAYIEGLNGKKSLQEINFNNICTTFERDGFQPDYMNVWVKKFGVTNGRKVAKELGLPITDSLHCYQLLLIAEHPAIQPNFLKDLCLFDKNEQQTGFRANGDACWVLDGKKRRRGSNRAQYIIELNPTTKKLVEEVIDLTSALRAYLRSINDDNWRRLFLSCGHGFSKPKPIGRIKWNKTHLEAPSSVGVVDSFYHVMNADRKPEDRITRAQVINFISRVSLGTLRASSGVKVYLETKSVDKMAKVLGHSQYSTKLLSHYLPEALLAFFQTRWIRVFQRGLICEAMRESPYLLRAASFQKMEDLHEFLTNHGLGNIPAHLSNLESSQAEIDEAVNSHVVIKVDIGILTALLSIEQAVKNTVKQNSVSGLARYWRDVSQALTHEIEQGGDPLLIDHLNRARKFIDPDRMGNIIYETP